MTLQFIPVKTDRDQKLLAQAAEEIWNEYWPAIIGEDQTRYMVQNFQSLEAIKRDMSEHDYEYWLLVAPKKELGVTLDIAETLAGSFGETGESDFVLVGYTGGHIETQSNRFFISKIYLFQAARGHGFGRAVIDYYKALCAARSLDALYLTVNKNNSMAIRAYKGTGFEVIDAVETEIGEGFVMDDYIMELRLQTPF